MCDDKVDRDKYKFISIFKGHWLRSSVRRASMRTRLFLTIKTTSSFKTCCVLEITATTRLEDSVWTTPIHLNAHCFSLARLQELNRAKSKVGDMPGGYDRLKLIIDRIFSFLSDEREQPGTGVCTGVGRCVWKEL